MILIFTVDDDKTAKQWKMDGRSYGEEEEPLPTILERQHIQGLIITGKNLFFHMWTQITLGAVQRTNLICSMTGGFTV